MPSMGMALADHNFAPFSPGLAGPARCRLRGRLAYSPRQHRFSVEVREGIHALLAESLLNFFPASCLARSRLIRGDAHTQERAGLSAENLKASEVEKKQRGDA